MKTFCKEWRYFVKFNKANNRFEINDSLRQSVVCWYMGASLAYNKLEQLRGE